MKKVLAVFVLVMLLYVPVMAQEKSQPLTQIEQLSQNLVDWKYKYGAETMLSAKLQSQLMGAQRQIRQLQAEIKTLKVEKKPDVIEETKKQE